MVDVRLFNLTQSYAIQAPFNAQLLDIIQVLPGAVELKKLAIALLTLVTPSAFTLPVPDCLIELHLGRFISL